MELTVILSVLFLLFASLAECMPLPARAPGLLAENADPQRAIVESTGIRSLLEKFPYYPAYPRPKVTDGYILPATARTTSHIPHYHPTDRHNVESRPRVLVYKVGSAELNAPVAKGKADDHLFEAGKPCRGEGGSTRWTALGFFVLMFLACVALEEAVIAKEDNEKRLWELEQQKELRGPGVLHLKIEGPDEKTPLSICAEDDGSYLKGFGISIV